MSKKICSAVLFICLLVSLLTLPVSAYDVDGIEGVMGYDTNITYELMFDEGNLRMWGSGPMYNHDTVRDWHWYPYRDAIKTVTLQNTITTLGDYVFYYCKNLSNVYMGNVTRIGDYALTRTDSLKSITLPNTLTEIGCAAFSGTALESLNVPSSVKTIDKFAFNGSGLKTLTLNEGLQTIGDGAFSSCWYLQSAKIPDSVTYLGTSAFEYAEAMTSLTIGNGVTEIPNEAFRNCGVLETLKLGNNVKKIGDYAFYQAVALKSLTLPQTVTSIGDYAFQNCRALTELSIPQNTTTIGNYAFQFCDGLTDLNITGGTKSIGNSAFANCDNIPELVLPEGVESIGNYAFLNCDAITRAVLPESLVSMGEYAFKYCNNLESVTIGTQLTAIPYGAFSSCNNLKDVYYLGTKAQWNAINIANGNTYLTNATVHCLGEKYTVSYDSNGGTWAPLSQQKTTGEILKLSSSIPIKEGYIFKEWNTSANGQGTSYQPVDEYTIDADVTLYAQWEPIKYTVTYNANGGTASAGSKTVSYGANADLTVTASKAGYRFLGWSTDENATEIISSYKVTGDIVLYAVYTEALTGIVLDSDGYYKYYKDGVVQTGWQNVDGYRYYFSSSSSKYGAAMTSKNIKVGGTYYDFTDEGKLIAGYDAYGNALLYLVDPEDTYITKGSDGYYRYYIDGEAQTGWQITPVGYKYYFSTSSSKYGAAMTGANKKVGSSYYDFANDGKLISAYDSSGNAEYFYDPVQGIVYTVTYDGNGGKTALSSKKARVNTNADLTVAAEKSGYDFLGWSTDVNATEAMSSVVVDKNITLYAIYEESESGFTGVVLDSDGYYRYYVNGVIQTGWQTTSLGYKYYFSSSSSKYGAAMTGTNKRVGSSYYDFTDDGKLIESYDEDGNPVLYQKINGFVTDGDGNTKYYVDSVPLKGWQYIDGNKYYFSTKSENLLKGYAKIGSIYYNLDATDGHWIGYFQEDKSEDECLKSDLLTKGSDGKYRYYVNGTPLTGWKVLKGETGYYKYYFSKNGGGAIATYATQVGGAIYDFSPTGTLITVTRDDNGNAVMSDYILSFEQGAKNGIYLDDDGEYRYYVDGEYQTGVFTIDGDKYIFRVADGSAVTSDDHNSDGYYKRGSFRYVLDETGRVLSKKIN